MGTIFAKLLQKLSPSRKTTFQDWKGTCIATMLLPQSKPIFGQFLASFGYFFWHIRLSGNSANAFSSDLNSICRNEVQTSRFEDAKRGR